MDVSSAMAGKDANFDLEVFKDKTAPGSGVDLRAATFGEILRWRAGHQGDDRAFVFLDLQLAIAEELTFSALDFRASWIARELTEKN